MLYTISSGHIYFHNQKFAPSDHFTNFTSPPAPDSGNQPICSLQLRVWEKEMATHPLQYSCLENPMDGAAWQATVHGVTKSRTRLSDFTFTFHFSLTCTGEGNGNPLQCSCLENPRDGGAWWAAVYGVAQSRTRLKRLSSSSN